MPIKGTYDKGPRGTASATMQRDKPSPRVELVLTLPIPGAPRSHCPALNIVLVAQQQATKDKVPRANEEEGCEVATSVAD